MKEYWVNVYADHTTGLNYESREEAERLGRLMMLRYECLVVYRIHVRLK